jgi:hypothetical protein
MDPRHERSPMLTRKLEALPDPSAFLISFSCGFSSSAPVTQSMGFGAGLEFHLCLLKHWRFGAFGIWDMPMWRKEARSLWIFPDNTPLPTLRCSGTAQHTPPLIPTQKKEKSISHERVFLAFVSPGSSLSGFPLGIQQRGNWGATFGFLSAPFPEKGPRLNKFSRIVSAVSTTHLRSIITTKYPFFSFVLGVEGRVLRGTRSGEARQRDEKRAKEGPAWWTLARRRTSWRFTSFDMTERRCKRRFSFSS